jgi:hypothetical protein
LTLENMQFELGDPEADQGVLGLTTCRRVTLTNCRTPILKNPDDNLRDAVGLNGAQNVAFYGGEIAGFVCEEFSREIECHGTRLSGDFGVRPNCEDVRVYGGDHMLRYFGANGDRFHMSGCRVYAVAFGIVGASPGLVGVEFQAPIVHVLESPCKNAFIAGIRVGPGGSIGLAVGSTGQYLPAMGGGTINDLTGGGWTAIS